MILGIAGATLASSAPVSTRQAYAALGVTGVTVTPLAEGQAAGLTRFDLAVADVHAASTLLRRRAVIVDPDGGFTVGGLAWRLTAGLAPLTALDHVVVRTTRLERATAAYGARLGLDLRLDRTVERFGFRGQWYRCGPNVIEVVTPLAAGPPAADRDEWGGIAWRVADVGGVRQRLAAMGYAVSDSRPGRKPGTVVATVRDDRFATPTLLISDGDAIAPS